VSKNFTDKEIDVFFDVWLAEYPNALQEDLRILSNPFKRNERLVARSIQQKRKTAEKLEFFKTYEIGHPHAFLDLHRDVMERVFSLCKSNEVPIQLYTDDQIDEVLTSLANADANFVKRALFDMKYPFFHLPVPDSPTLQELGDVAMSFDWFAASVATNPSAILHLHTRLMTKIATESGLIGINEVLE